MTKTTINGAVTILGAGMLLTGILAPSAVTGADVLEDMKARARALLPAPSPISAAMSARAVALPLDDFALTTELLSVHFDLARAASRPAERKVADTNAEWLWATPSQPIVVEDAAAPPWARELNVDAPEPLADRSDQAVEGALKGALHRGVRGATAMGLSWICLDRALVLTDKVIVSMVATDDDVDDDDVKVLDPK